MNSAPANEIPDSLKRLLDAAGAETSFVQRIDYGTQYRITRGTDAATLNVYRTGNVSTGGKASPLLEEIEAWRLARMDTGKQGSSSPAGRSVELDGTPRVGMDEAGKGDYLGPLVVAGVRVSGEESARRLREIGARDSKTLSVPGAKNLARRILESVGEGNARVVVLTPREYEARRKAAGNVNKQEVGFELPRGATHVVEAARRVVEERGMEGLAEVAKVHFGTTAGVLGAPEKVGE
ncbi:MAG: hypothetical protein LC740_01485 [Actinobacteria bacterium]|nr:hypothetical protein [Actinomycetota bacterium]